MKLSLTYLLLLANLTQIFGYSYLMVLPTAATSHFYVGQALAKGLAASGHQVTLISAFPQKKPIRNLHDVPVKNLIGVMSSFKDKLFENAKMPLIVRLPFMHKMGLNLTVTLLEDPAVQTFLQEKHSFDAVICEVFMNEAHFGFAEHFNAPLIGLSAFGASSWTTAMVGTPSPTSHVPHFLLNFSDHMNFFERAQNWIFSLYDLVQQHWDSLPQQEEVYKKFFPNNKQNFYDMRKNTALVLLNNHVSLGFPRPYAPNMIEVGGMHINRKRTPLPYDIEQFIKGAEHGVIYFSMGSNLKSKDLPLERRRALIETFRQLKQRVLWKFEEPNMAGKPENVFISDWFPQDDVLAHENVILFITHGGLLSTTESIYHGKPVLGIPIFGDQFTNMARAEKSGYGVSFRLNQLTTETFKSSIDSIISNPSYMQQAQAMSLRYRDQRELPLDRAVYWVEYVTRHKGAKYLRSGAQDLGFIEYHNVDILVMFIGGLSFIIFAFLYLLVTPIRTIGCKLNANKHSPKKLKTN